MKEEYEMTCLRQGLRGYAKGLQTVGSILLDSSVSQRVVKENLFEMASYMTHMSYSSFSGSPLDERKKKYLGQILRGQGILLEEGYSKREKSGEDSYVLLLRTKGNGVVEAEKVASVLSLYLECTLQPQAVDPTFVTKQPAYFHFTSLPKYMVLTGYARAKKEGEDISGDHFSMEEWPGQSYGIMLSDGTGSGEHASEQSDRLLSEMETLICSHFSPESAIHLVNIVWSAMEEGNGNPTLDMARIDLNNGQVAFYKLGAPATFLKQGTNVEAFGDVSFPVGLFDSSEAIRFSATVSPGDTLFFVTDGVTNAFLSPRAKLSIQEVIGNIETGPLCDMATLLLQAAILQAGGEVRDDMTVVTVRLEKRVIT